MLQPDAGINGYCFANRAAQLKDVIDRGLRVELLGQDPLQREYLCHRLWEIDRIDCFPM